MAQGTTPCTSGIATKKTKAPTMGAIHRGMLMVIGFTRLLPTAECSRLLDPISEGGRLRPVVNAAHVARCENAACGHTLIAYNSCRNRHCPKCQAASSRRWLADREAELLPVPYFHVVYTLPSKLR